MSRFTKIGNKAQGGEIAAVLADDMAEIIMTLVVGGVILGVAVAAACVTIYIGRE